MAASMINLKTAPFYLSGEDILWVEETLAGMSTEDKIGQLFCLTGGEKSLDKLGRFIGKYRPGAYMNRVSDAKTTSLCHETLQKSSKVPMLIAANLESGGNGITDEGTYFAKQLQIAATGDREMAYKLGLVCAREGGAVGCNWSFAPIVDIDYNWRNPITNVRTFGNDPAKVYEYASSYLKGVRDSKTSMAVCIKHFPGDGVDERDHHLLPSVNSLTADQWKNSYQMVYQKLIDEGAQTVMIGHILQPAMTRNYNPGLTDDQMMPASTNRYLVTNLLREEMGFNGLVVTDATPMVGYSAMLPRKKAIQASIMAGVDMILFCKNIDEDYAAIRDGLEDGTITTQRLEDAVRRVLATKAGLQLHKKTASGTTDNFQVLACAEHTQWARDCAQKAITLVKDNQKLLPITPQRYRRIRLTVLGEREQGAFGDNGSVGPLLQKALEDAGFEVSLYDDSTLEHGEIFTAGAEEMKSKFDVSLIAANIATGSNHTTRRVDWIPLMAANAPWYAREIPTLFVSFANPYHLFDVPFLSTFINCYSSNRFAVEACVDKLTGKSSFQGISPVDVWCGDVWGAKFM